ncbi:MAG: TIGR02266 family protein [Myxococcaceae bacterium]|nr:TIGR02266 family protein [Myxococcaceae bacterium]MCA3012673.1 TIGR02266 family protein [Myxococcaceae bacterium]
MSSAKPIQLSVRLPFATPEAFLQGYGLMISRGGIYLRARRLHPPGTPVTLEVKLEDGKRLLYANATVSWVTGTRGEGVAGMGFKFITLDATSRRFLEAAAAAMPHARSPEPPVPRNVGPIDTHPDAVAAPPPSPPPAPVAPASADEPPPLGAESAPPPSQLQPVLPSEQAGRLVVQGAAEAEVRAPAFEGPLTEPARAGPIIGIGLGATNAYAAVVSGGQPTVLRAKDGASLVPVVVALTPRGKLVVGAPARGQSVTNPKWTVSGFRRLVGLDFDSPEVDEVAPRVSHELAGTEPGTCGVRLADRIYPLEQMVALVLREVRLVAEQALERPVSRAVIAVPAWYTEAQRQAVHEAGRLAGLHVERVIDEPTAAALAWGHGRRRSERVFVYDLGGSAFDAAVLELDEGGYRVVARGGDPALGGADFDRIVVEWLLAELAAKHGVPVVDRTARQRVQDAAERAKIALSEATETRVHVPFLTMAKDQPVDLDVVLTRAQLAALTRPLVERTIELCEAVLRERFLRVDQIDEVLLVGGQARAPLVQEQLTSTFGRRPLEGVPPDEAVVRGAALLGSMLEEKAARAGVGVLPRSIGVGLPGGRFYPVIRRGTALPATRSYRVQTTRDAQAELELALFQGEAPLVKDDHPLGVFRLSGLPRQPKGTVSIELSFELSGECVLTIRGTEPSSGRVASSVFATEQTPEATRRRIARLEGVELTPDELEAAGASGLFGLVRRFLGS